MFSFALKSLVNGKHVTRHKKTGRSEVTASFSDVASIGPPVSTHPLVFSGSVHAGSLRAQAWNLKNLADPLLHL